MKELIIAFGLFLFIEGILYALFPSKMKSMLKKLDLINDNQLRMGGLIFAVIGFIIMLSSIVTIENFDLSLMQTLLQKMSAGMMIALYTTLTGLVSSILLAFQNKILEGGIYDIYAYSKEIKSRINTK